MKCPRLKDLPPPPTGKTGWPWTEESPELPDLMTDGRDWPQISIVTPSYNQGQYIEETIRSVLLQGYPNLNYIVIDGGSRDASVKIIEKYENWLDFWVSEPDDGQTDAINKGLEAATGVLANWLNSDDAFLAGALTSVATEYLSNNAACLYNGSAIEIGADGSFLRNLEARELSAHSVLDREDTHLPQPAIFFRLDRWRDHGKLKKHLYYCMDYEFFISCLLSGHAQLVEGSPLAMMRIHEGAKTTQRNCGKPMRLEKYEALFRLYRSDELSSELREDIEYGLSSQCFQLFRRSLGQWSDVFEALLWLSRAFLYSPRRTVSRCAYLLRGQS